MGVARRYGFGMIAGAVFTSVVFLTTTAYAGSGIGGVFNLGQSNSVNETTTLTGAKAGAMLQVTNTNSSSGATGLAVTVPGNLPPLTVSSEGLVRRLNADEVDGFQANNLNRVATANASTIFAGLDPTKVVTATINTAKTGFVIARGQALVTDDFSSQKCGSCYFHMYLHDETANTTSVLATARIGTGTARGDYAELANEWVFPVTKGTRTFSMRIYQVALDGGTGEAANPVLVLQFVPFDGNGAQAAASSASTSGAGSGAAVSESGAHK
jgi:hypothetical protein